MSRFPLRDRSRTLLILGVVALLGSACVRPDDPGVGVKALKADIVFGLKDPVEPAKPSGTDTPDTPGGFSFGNTDLPGFFLPDPVVRRPGPTFGASAPRPTCPPAAINAFPAEEASINVPFGRKPAEGVYRWKKAGEVTFNNVKSSFKDVFDQRAIRNVRVLEQQKNANDPSDPTGQRKRDNFVFTYETVAPDLDGRTFIITTYRVDTSTISTEYNSPVSGHRAVGGEPERGITIERIERVNERGQSVGGTFDSAAGPGLLLVPLEVRPGEQFVSAASDPKTGQVMRLEGTVLRRQQIDACGDVLAGWRIESKLTIASPGGTVTQTYNYVVAPQLGGVIINEYVESSQTQPPVTLKIEYTQGQLKPDAPKAG